MFLDYGSRSKCCYAPIRLGKKKIKKSKVEVKIWICCKCGTRDVDIVDYSKEGPPVATRFALDTDEDDVIESE